MIGGFPVAQSLLLPCGWHVRVDSWLRCTCFCQRWICSCRISLQGVGKTFTLELRLRRMALLPSAQKQSTPAPCSQGVGKTFTLELCLRRMGVLPVCLSAGELEDEWAGEPGRRLRERYAFAGGCRRAVNTSDVCRGGRVGREAPPQGRRLCERYACAGQSSILVVC